MRLTSNEFLVSLQQVVEQRKGGLNAHIRPTYPPSDPTLYHTTIHLAKCLCVCVCASAAPCCKNEHEQILTVCIFYSAAPSQLFRLAGPEWDSKTENLPHFNGKISWSALSIVLFAAVAPLVPSTALKQWTYNYNKHAKCQKTFCACNSQNRWTNLHTHRHTHDCVWIV